MKPKKTSEVIFGETPNGGVKAEIYYMNDSNEAVEKEIATKAVIRELDKDGNLVYETWGIIGG